MSLSNRLGLLGRKVGMMRIFTDDGDAIPVTVLDVSNNRVTQVKTDETDGYTAVQVAYGTRKASRVTKPEAGHLAKAGVEAGEVLKEFRVAADVAAGLKAGATIPVTTFAVGQLVDVQGTSIGKGFTGTIKRHNFGSQRASHGNSRSHNVPGSISMAQDPARLDPGLGQVPGFGLADTARLARAEGQLQRVVAVAGLGLDLRDAVVGHVEHGHGDGVAIVREDAHHAHLPTEQAELLAQTHGLAPAPTTSSWPEVMEALVHVPDIDWPGRTAWRPHLHACIGAAGGCCSPSKRGSGGV